MATQVRKLEVFLSYLTIEAKFADSLKEHLVNDFIGLVRVFVASDGTSIPVGSKWLEEVVNALEKAHLQLILCSPDALGRPWIHYEAGAARVRGIETVPLCHGGLVPGQLPVPLSESEGIVVTEADGLRKLYQKIADFLGSDVPDVDFTAYGQEFQRLEAAHKEQRPPPNGVGARTESRIPHPRVVCVTSEQFKKLGFENQLKMVLDAFPGNVTHEIASSSSQLTRILTSEHVDILHIAAFVCPRGGAIYFSDVDLQTGIGRAPADQVDKMDPASLSALLIESRTALVVVGSCESLVLVTRLLSATHLIVASDMVSTKSMAVWVENFYRTLKTRSLAESYKLATDVSRAPMTLYARQGTPPEVAFSSQPGERLAATAADRQTREEAL